MAQQVKEVLPDTPLSVIEKDLCKLFLDYTPLSVIEKDLCKLILD